MDYVSMSESLSMSTVTSPFVTAETWTVISSTVRANRTNEGFEDLKMDSNFITLLCSLISAICWLMYITFYNSRVTGYAVTRLVNRFYVSDGAYFKLGSVTINVLSGKIMFRDVAYITQDWSGRVQDGYLIFRWWRSYVPKDATEDLSHSDTRLSVVLNGAELHVYNRSTLYARLERIFGLEPFMRSNGSDDRPDGSEAAMNDENTAATANISGDQRLETTERAPSRSEAAMARTWRDLIPVIKMDVSSGRVVFGNRLVPTTLSVAVEESHWVYSTKPPASPMDRLMHFCKCWAENARVMLAPSPKYTGMLDEPPRYMGEGFVLASTNYLELYAYMDEPGYVPERPVLARLANGDAVESSPPMWGVDIKCGKGTDFSYGPWADRQREHLFRFFFPQDYQALKPTPEPCPGEKRIMHTFDIRLSMLNEATIDLLFSEKNKETNAVHVNVGAGSYLEVTLPWITLADGYTTRVNGQLLHLEATTSLPYRHLVQSETLEFAVNCHYPLIWNHHQQWELSLTGCKATVHLTYAHKTFFQDLINDWSSKQRPDVMHFVPYTWRLGLTLKHCELITPTNEYNWLDCSSGGRAHTLENAQLALCAHLFHLSFELPFDQFLPDTTTLNFVIQGESIDLSLYLPETHTSRVTALALEREARVLSKDSSAAGLRRRQENIPKWRNVCQRQDGWLDFWWVPIGAINIQWVYHPAPPLGPQPQADISTPVKEELLLSPMRFPHHKPPTHAAGRSHCRTGRSPASDPQRRFDPTTLASDRVTVELEIGPSVLLLYGSALRNFLHIKENVFGDDQTYTDMQNGQSHQQQHLQQQQIQADLNGVEPHAEEFDQRDYRPLEVDVSIIMHDIQAHLLKHCAPGEPPCPVLLLERFGFEMKKRYEQTELQLLLSPAVLLIQDTLSGRSPSDKQLGAGRLALSSLQLRGHAMFSDTDRALDEETLEYAWLLELQLGRLSGRLTAPQLHQLVTSLETLVLLATDPENELNSPNQTWQQQQQQQSPPSTEQQQQQYGGVVNAALHTLLQPRQQQDRRSVSQGAGPPVSTNTSTVAQPTNNSSEPPSNVGDHQKQPPSRQTSRTEPPEKQQPTVVETLSEPDAHKLKYKFVRVAVDVLDFWLVESGTALQLWISPVRLATCNLHGRRVSSGLSCVLYNGQLRQLTCQARAPSAQDLWLEVANVSLGNLLIESVMSVSGGAHDKELPNQQDAFLRLHDTRTKRLWFLWPEVARGGSGRCGCTGGTAFFGNNRNGPRFFRPSPQDLVDGINVACFRINEQGRDPGYGQSILHEGQLLFRTPPYVAAQDIRLQEPPPVLSAKPPTAQHQTSESQQRCASPEPRTARSSSRRFSYTLTRSGRDREVPYARLVDMAGPATLPAKLDSDSKLHQERPERPAAAGAASHTRSALDVPGGPEAEQGPKNSVSDSKLAVDYFSGGGESVNESESQHSLEERLRREVQRTTSMSSENQSEAFFSADEELNASRTSSLRHSIVSTGGALASHAVPVTSSSVQQSAAVSPAVAVREHGRKKFASDLSIVMDRTGIAAADVGGGSGPNSLPEGVRSRLSSHRSDHEIHTPEHRGSNTFRRHHHQSKTSRTTIRRDSDEQSVNCDSSDSRSLSSNSYVSAVCSQEDMTLVDLHMQLNRQILDSPMLMSSYVSHLTQARCLNWNASTSATVSTAAAPPLFKQQDDGKLQYIGGIFVPHMDTVAEGVTLLRLVTRHDIPPTNTPTPTTGVWDGRGVADMNDQHQDATKTEEEDEMLLGTAAERAEQSGVICSRTALVVRLQGELHVTVTPLLLESLQRFVDALVPTLAAKHPLTVINKLHASCISQVVGANTLKREKGVALRMDGSGTYEQSVRTQLQAAVVLPRINVTLLQASIVEEIITFSALDNIRDLTCVSLFAVCFDRVTARFHSGRQARELVQIFQRPTVTTGSFSGKKRQGPMAFLAAAAAAHGPSDRRATAGGAITGEPVFIETSEKQQEETVVSLCVGRVHAQLRRLTNESSCLEDAVITAIPPHSSKVLFSMRTATRSGPVDHYYMKESEQHQPEEQNKTPTPPLQHDQDRLGFIMFECGLEGVSVKVVKRSQFEKADGSNEDKLTCKTDSDIYICAESVRSRDDVDSVDKSEASTQTTLTSQQQHMQQQQQKEQHTETKPPPPPPKEETPPKETGGTVATVPPVPGGNVSSCVIDLKTVWFNFAAPPRAPITRKLDYTRLDWNLLSTASPAINAWMNPSNRLAIRCVAAARTMYRRETGAVACLMAEALDVQQIHVPVRGRFGRLTPLASTLQEDPSCQLCAVLERYVLQVADPAQLEAALADGELPQLSTLRQGVIVLSRQWKNVLYTPLLLDHNYKSKYVRPLNVTFTLPDMDEMCLTDGEASGNDEQDVTDECAMLLRTEALLKPKAVIPGPHGGPLAPVNSPRVPIQSEPLQQQQPAQVAVIAEGIESVLTSPSPPAAPHRRHRRVHHQQVIVNANVNQQQPPSSRASVVFPILAGNNPWSRRVDESVGYGALREAAGTGAHLGSEPSVCTHSSPELPSSPTHRETTAGQGGSLPTNPLAVRCSSSAEDLYSWMAKQQEYVRSLSGQQQQQQQQHTHKDLHNPTTAAKLDTLGTDSSGGGEQQAAGVSLYPMRDSLRLLDAHMIFQPLLSSLGVLPHQMVTSGAAASSLDSLGSNFSLVGAMDQMRIDIVVSDSSSSDEQRRDGERERPAPRIGKLRVDCTDETPAFVCERVSVELELEKMADMTVDDMIRTKNVLYISRGQLKKHTSTALNFSIAVRQIAQQVNMPLLRLLHQISNMYQNVKDTQNELREQRPPPPRHDIDTEASARRSPPARNNRSSSASDLVEHGVAPPQPPLTLKVSDPSSILSGQQQPHRPVVSPSASVRSRPQSFAQKLRSTGKSVKGYMNLNEGVGTPVLASSPSASVAASLNGHPNVDGRHCWKTVYHLLELYATMPDTKTITHRFSVAHDTPAAARYKYDLLNDTKSCDEFQQEAVSSTPVPATQQQQTAGERTRLVVFGVARIHRTRLLATLSGLKLEAEITSAHSSLTCRKKSRPATLEFSLTGQVGRTMIVLLEGVAPSQQTVVRVTVGKSQALYSSVSKRGRDKNSGLLTVGAVSVDIPQHPVALHGMVTRGSKQLSSTLQELRVQRTASRISRQDTVIGGLLLAEEPQTATVVTIEHSSPSHQTQQQREQQLHQQENEDTPRARPKHDHVAHSRTAEAGEERPPLLQGPLVMQFSVIVQSLGITAALLPSLQAQYKMDQVNSTGVTGSRAKFTVDLPQHSLSFTTKLQAQSSEANLPAEASIALPAVHVTAEYVPEAEGTSSGPEPPVGLQLRRGGYLAAHADIGVFEHSLTTDLLNHLVFVQKVFMREVNEVVQKVYGGERPVPLWLADQPQPQESSVKSRSVLFTLVIRLQRIQLTATTAGSSAVRLETGALHLELNNRVQAANPSAAPRLFGKAHVDVNLSLGQLTRNPMFDEAEPDFQQFAFFNTRIGLRNAFQDEPSSGADSKQDNKEVVLITLKRPLIYVQPLAVDKAILVWLNYKNAYDYWNEKRANLNKEVLTATQQVLERVAPLGQLGAPLSQLFLQLTVDDMGICLPLNPPPTPSAPTAWLPETRGAVVVTLESTSIAACSSGSLVSKGRFANLCLRFADDFDPSLDDWKPDMTDTTLVNLCVVSEGTYEVCSRTVAARQSALGDTTTTTNAKWFLNVQWQMEGVDMNVDVSVGKQLSALGHTLTMLAGSEDGPARAASGSPPDTDSDEQDIFSLNARPLVSTNLTGRPGTIDSGRASQDSVAYRTVGETLQDSGLLPAFVFDSSLDSRKRSRLIEKEMNEQAKIINDLRSLGASHHTIEQEMRRLHELEALVFKDFRRDMIQKLRRQSVKASSIKGKLGLGSGASAARHASAYRSRSFIVPSPTPERRPVTYQPQPDSPPEQRASYESSPRSGPSRSASLRVRGSYQQQQQQRVTFSQQDDSISNNYVDVDGQRVELRRSARIRNNTDDSEQDQEVAADVQQHTMQSSVTTPAGGSTSGGGSATTKSHEPNIDFELDVKVLINSGKCVLHTKEPVSTEDSTSQNRLVAAPARPLRKDRSCSAGLLDFGQTGSSAGSPDTGRRNKGGYPGGRYARDGQRTATSHTPAPNQLIDLTIFRIPGMDVKVHYESKVLPAEENQQSGPQRSRVPDGIAGTPDGSDPSSDRTATGNRNTDSEEDTDGLELLDQEQDEYRIPSLSLPVKGFCNPNYSAGRDSRTATGTGKAQTSAAAQVRPPHVKKASLFAWMTLQSIPEETIISPHILEFLEQTLEPLPQTAPSKQSTSTSGPPPFELSEGAASVATYNYVYASSFPVDVIVYFHMQPSTFRFSCLPVSRVECMLQLPSLDIVFSSKRADEPMPEQEQLEGPPAAIGGLSVTGCLADFSVYIFHPYGGGKKASGSSSSGASGLAKDSQVPQWSPLADTERKDSLSINVEFVKFHLSRSRKLNFQQDDAGSGGGGRSPADQSRAVIRFSTIIDIGSASFKYDMRRLTEILAFPKAWYRHSIVRRLFLGDLSYEQQRHDQQNRTSENDRRPNEHHDVDSQAQTSVTESPLSRSAPEERSAHGRANNRNRDRLRLSLETGLSGRSRHRHARLSLGSSSSSESDSDTGDLNSSSRGRASSSSTWETLVLFAVNFTRLNVHMNMGNVMGNVTWQSKDFRSEGRLGIGSTGRKNLYIGLGLGGSALDAKGGIVGGTFELADIETYVRVREEPGERPEPDHTVGARLHALELRLDYMGISVLMCRVSALDVTLRDEWRLQTLPALRHDATRRPATVFVHGVLGWKQLQCLISKSSTADLIKMYYKLDEFFSQQFNSSKRAFSRFGGGGSSNEQGASVTNRQQSQHDSEDTTPGSSEKKSGSVSGTFGLRLRHHRHWQRALAHSAGLKLRHWALPEAGTVLGGTMELHGQNVSLACFHGINFKSKSWALFSLREPSVSFNTEAQEIASNERTAGPHDVHVVQTLTCSLGLSTYKTHHSMATVCKVSRSVMFPPQFKSLHEWFHYAFASSQIDEVDRFPSLELERQGPTGKLIDPNHTREVIFALPSLQLHLKTEHLQTAETPNGDDNDIPRPTVDCSFITEFEDHIFVTVDAEAFFFLHDLISSYLKEKDRVMGGVNRRNNSSRPNVGRLDSIGSGTDTTNSFREGNSTGTSRDSDDSKEDCAGSGDWRLYRCKTWHLEPTVRLLSWAGKSIEPYGIDYILQKLGFSHARTTIPKWMQRGFMDPLDKVLAVLALRMVTAVRHDPPPVPALPPPPPL